MFRRFALYGFDPPQVDKIGNKTDSETETQALKSTELDPELELNLLPKRFGNSTRLAESIPISEYQGRPLADHSGIKYGRPPGALRVPREPLDAVIVAEAVSVISLLVCQMSMPVYCSREYKMECSCWDRKDFCS